MRIMTKKYHQNQRLKKNFLVIRLGSNFLVGYCPDTAILHVIIIRVKHCSMYRHSVSGKLTVFHHYVIFTSF